MIGSELLDQIIHKKNYIIYGMDNFVLGKKNLLKNLKKKILSFLK